MTLTAGTPATTARPSVMPRPHVRVLTDRCAGCQECVVRCPAGALSMDTRLWVATADDDACIGCRQCVRTCPFSAIDVDGPVLVAARAPVSTNPPRDLVGDLAETRPGFADYAEARAEASRCLACPDPTCVRGCPAHNDIPAFVAAVRDGDLTLAHEVLRRTTVLPDICSRVCNQAAQCEGACTWSLAGGEPVSIGRLERFVADQIAVAPPVVPAAAGAPGEGLSVAVVGSGPAGAGAAWALVEGGASVTVYEKDSQPGGLYNWGIPDFTLPPEVADRPWRQLVAAGVDLRCGSEVTPGQLDELLLAHDAVVLAHGAGEPLRLRAPGADLGGVVDATTFLKGAKEATGPGGDVAAFTASLGLHPRDGKASGYPRERRRAPQVLVLGAGNTAMDVARTSRRLGLGAVCVDWVDERYALARPDEVEEARQEGVDVRFLRTVSALEGDHGRVQRALLARTEQSHAGRRPRVLKGTPEVLEVDLVVMAMGYRLEARFSELLPGTPVAKVAAGVPDRRWLASGVLATTASAAANHYPVGRLSLGREVTLDASMFPFRPRVWVAGDALTGPSTVVEAMAQGRRAAAAVLDARPARRTSNGARSSSPGQGGTRNGVPRRQWRALVCYESAGGRTAAVAHEVAKALEGPGAQVHVLPLSRVTAVQLAEADLVVVGAWTEGLFVARAHPARKAMAWLDGLPRLAGKQTAVFCTYGVSPKGVLAEMRKALEAKGADVVCEAAFAGRQVRGGAVHGATASFGRQLSAATFAGFC